MTYNPKPRGDLPLNGAHLDWEREMPHQSINVSKCLFSNLAEKTESLQFVTSGALLQNKATLCDTWARTKLQLKRSVLVGDMFHIHNEEKTNFVSSHFGISVTLWKFEKNASPRKQHFIKAGKDPVEHCFCKNTHYLSSLKDNCEVPIIKLHLNEGSLLFSLCFRAFFCLLK